MMTLMAVASIGKMSNSCQKRTSRSLVSSVKRGYNQVHEYMQLNINNCIHFLTLSMPQDQSNGSRSCNLYTKSNTVTAE